MVTYLSNHGFFVVKRKKKGTQVSFFQEKPIKSNNDIGCNNCKQIQGVFVNHRQTSWVLAGTLLLCFFVFIAGYFLGQKKVIERFTNKAEQDSLADKITSSIYSMYDTKAEVESLDSVEGNETPESEEPTAMADGGTSEASEITVAQSEVKKIDPMQPTSKTAVNEIQDSAPQKQYYAELVGFGSLKAAQEFAQRLESKKISVTVKKRESRTAKGKKIAWYQVITGHFKERSELMALVDRLKQEERLKGVHIVTC